GGPAVPACRHPAWDNAEPTRHVRPTRPSRVQASHSDAAMPRGITYMKTIKQMPYIAQGAAFEISCAQFGTNWMKSAPKIAPEMDASPPMTIPTRNVIDRNTLNASGATKAMASAERAPATPVYAALTPKVSDL